MVQAVLRFWRPAYVYSGKPARFLNQTLCTGQRKFIFCKQSARKPMPDPWTSCTRKRSFSKLCEAAYRRKGFGAAAARWSRKIKTVHWILRNGFETLRSSNNNRDNSHSNPKTAAAAAILIHLPTPDHPPLAAILVTTTHTHLGRI